MNINKKIYHCCTFIDNGHSSIYYDLIYIGNKKEDEIIATLVEEIPESSTDKWEIEELNSNKELHIINKDFNEW